MFIRTATALALILAAAAAAIAAPKGQSTAPRSEGHDVYDQSGKYVGTDPDANIRFQLRRDSLRGRY